ncbi:helix-turn-helix transcriptional regulator, partial [Nocardioides sp.]|uniref:helix-turn-helix domain-containing protein n=1 Tax=Nocardioides sp. TaxID=35761 RepID=UPI002734A53A
MLDELGLDQNLQLVYLALLGDPAASLTSLQDSVGMSESEVRAALDRLAELALVRWVGNAERGLELVDPELGLKALLTRQRAEVLDRQRRLEESQLAVERWLNAHGNIRERASSSGVQRIDGLDGVRAKLGELAIECSDSIWSFNPDGAQTPANLAASRPLNSATLERGVGMRAVYLDSIRNDEPTRDHVAWLLDQGAEVRTVPVLPMRMILVDRRIALVPIDDQSSEEGAFLVTGTGLVAGLVALFLSTWRLAKAFGPHRPRRMDPLSTQERQALVLWAQGCTDASVARQLGVSERTVRRISEAIAERLGARSRFEAGARAMEMGWLDAADLR